MNAPRQFSTALIIAAFAALPASGWAAGAAPGPGAGQLLQLIGGLLVVIAAVILSARFLPRLQQGRIAGTEAMRIVDSLMVGQRQRVVLMQIGNRQVLVGVTPTQVTPLHVLEEPVAPREGHQRGVEENHWLTRMLGRKTP